MQPRPISVRGLVPARVSRLSALPLLAVLLVLSAAPARANIEISGNVTLPGDPTYGDTINDNVHLMPGAVLTLNAGGSLNGQISGSDGCTLNVSGGSVRDDIELFGGTMNISRGSVAGIVLYGGATLNISGGSLTQIVNLSGTVNIYGCGLQKFGVGAVTTVTGHLTNGPDINTSVLGDANLFNTPPAFTNSPTGTTAIANTSTAQGIGAFVPFSLTGTDACGGSATVSYSNGHTPGSFFPLGSTPVIATIPGTDATYPFYVTVAYAWSGFLQPINADGSSVFNAGRTIPVKFALTGPSAGITNAVATFTYRKVRSAAGVTVNEAESAATATGGTQFRYEDSGQYAYYWSTKGLEAGYVYELRCDLGDGVSRTVELALK